MSDSSDMAQPGWLEEIDHTGDIGILVSAPTLKTLYERAACGMFRVLTDVGMVRRTHSREIAVRARDREALLVEWLSELNYRHVTEHHLYAGFYIEHLNQHSLRGAVEGEPIDDERHTIYTEIKAITYHGLKIDETASGWQVQIIFDM